MGPEHGGGEDHTPPFETVYEYDSSGGTSMVPLPPRAASKLFKRKKLKSKKKKDGKRSQPLTENDIVPHVASKYVTGPGGVLYTSEMKRKKTEDVTTTASQLFEMDPTREGQIITWRCLQTNDFGEGTSGTEISIFTLKLREI
jgi:hypothetical protein